MNLFFELMQVALGRRSILNKMPSEQEWQELFDMSEKQAVAGMAMAALEKLSKKGQKPPMDLLYEWIGLSEQIRQENLRQNRYCKQLQCELGEAGLRSSILKGQGILLLYDECLRELRQSGDIDVYVDCGLKGAIEIARQFGVDKPQWDYKHLHLDVFEDAEVEMHYRVEVLLNLWKNRKLQKWFRAHTEEVFGPAEIKEIAEINPLDSEGHTENAESTEIDSTTNFTNDTNYSPAESTEHAERFSPAEIKEIAEIITPTVEFNVFYILLHIYRHFLYEGVGMRQIIDYYFVLKNLNNGLNFNSNTNLTDSYAVKAVGEFGLERFAKGLMWVMQEALGMPREWMLWGPDEKEGRLILDEVMAGGNFGHHDNRLTHEGGKLNTVKQVCKHNWHLMSHYPADVIWAPGWFVWHKCWKLAHGFDWSRRNKGKSRNC